MTAEELAGLLRNEPVWVVVKDVRFPVIIRHATASPAVSLQSVEFSAMSNGAPTPVDAALSSAPPDLERPARHGYGCPNDGYDMAPGTDCSFCCRHGWVERAQGKPCPQCPPASPVVAPAPVERDGVRVTEAGHAWPDVPGGVAKDHAREKQPAVAYACLYQRLAQVARDHGYALAMHGSLVADLDLVAVPWTPDAVSDMALASALAAAVPGSLHADQWTQPRPGGVKKHIIHLGGGPYLDLCVTPLAALSPRDTTGGGR